MTPLDYDVLTLEVPCTPKYLNVIRLAIAGAASRAGLTYDDIEVLKQAVGEACNNAIDHAFDQRTLDSGQAKIFVTMRVSDGEIRVEVEDKGRGFDPKRVLEKGRPDPYDRGHGIFIMRELADDVKIESAPGSGTKVTIVKRATR
ncbi:MAG: ATP-binding protein [Armatimonadetes bacterium]|nr:ATP-binding protein [Armatimonadota bacterium]